jgi:uncharacterized protein YabN with tetrapyrrole methylase and pyrophosphatase domain
MNNGSLTIVGSGIKFLSHLTLEAKTQIEHADRLLYLLNDPALQQWVQQRNPNAESLDSIYHQYKHRQEAYGAITTYILKTLSQHKHVCVLLYGHPTVFSQPALDAVREAKKMGYEVLILPGISAEDCLFADLQIDPGSSGCQSFEATDFLIHHRIFDPRSHLILWQVGIIGVLGHAKTIYNVKVSKVLINYLKKSYLLDHEVILYEAAQYPGFEPKIQQHTLNNLPYANFTRLSTLYIPPIEQTPYDKNIADELGIFKGSNE